MSLDFGLFAKLIVDSFTAKKEKYSNVMSYDRTDNNIFHIQFNALMVASIFISLILGIIAFLLSWSCNTAMGYNTVVKTVFGSVAFVFGFTYIILFLLMRWDVCSKIMRK